MISQFPRVTLPRMRPGRSGPSKATPGVPVLSGAPRLTYGAPNTNFRWGLARGSTDDPFASGNQTIAARPLTPVWERGDFIPPTPSYNGQPFGPELGGPAEDFEAIRLRAEQTIGRPIPTEVQLRARLGPAFDLSRYQDSVRRLADLQTGYPVRMPDGSSTVLSSQPATSGPSATDQLANMLGSVQKILPLLAIGAGLLFVLPMIRGRR